MHDVHLRQNNILSVCKHRTTYFQRCFSYTAVKLYNQLSSTMKDLSVPLFKKTIKKYLLDKYLSENE